MFPFRKDCVDSKTAKLPCTPASSISAKKVDGPPASHDTVVTTSAADCRL